MTAALEPAATGWESALAAQLYDGEEGIAATEVAGARVAVTTHRVLVYAPDTGTAGGTRFHAVDRPNVLGVGVTAVGGGSYAAVALRVGLYAVILFAAGFILDFDGLLGDVSIPESAPGVGGVIAVIRTITDLLALVDDVLLTLGVLVGLLALGLGAIALHSRTRYLQIDVAGGDPIRVPVEREHDVDAVVERIEAALETG